MSRVGFAESNPAYRVGGLALVLAIGAILTALAFEHIGGLEPCPLCLQQRYAFYAGIPALFVALVLVAADYPRLAALLFLAVAVAFLANTGLAVYHAGAEWKFWPGPDTCGQPLGELKPLGGAPLLEGVANTRVVRCDVAQGRLLGLSFAGWNVIGSGSIFVLAARAALGSIRRI